MAISIIWFLVSPGFFKRGLEEASQSSTTRLPPYIKLGLVATGVSTVALVILSLISARHESASSPQLLPSASSSDKSNNGVIGPDKLLPVSFESTYVKFLRPKPRVWIQTADHNWLETYDGQTSNVFTPEGSSEYKGCNGALLRKRGEDPFEVFLPYPNCPQLLMFRWQKGPWQELGPITNASQTVPSSSSFSGTTG